MSAMKDQLLTVAEAIDSVMGDGYARKNPELIGRMIQAEQTGFGLYQIAAAIREIEDEEAYTM